MSQLHRTPVAASIEPVLEDKVSDEETDYEPQHPTLSAIAGLKQAQDNAADHLDSYVEVNPFVEEEQKK